MDPGIENSRKHFIDNLRSIMVIIVIVYHVFYLFNSGGVPRPIGEAGIPAFDGLCYFVYPWLMTTMFLLAGISARYALQKRREKEFLKERVQKLLIPLFGGMFLLAWLNGWVVSRYVDVFGENRIPGVVRYLVYCLNIGPLWFLLELFLLVIVLLLLRRVDGRDRLWALAGSPNIFVLLLLALPFWGSSFLLNTPLLILFRNGIYLFVFLAGYYIFSHEKIIGILSMFRFPLLATGMALGIVGVYCFFGQDYSAGAFLEHPLTNLYAWIMMLAILGCSQRYLNKSGKFMGYLKSRSFLWYLTHFPIMSFIAYFWMTKFNYPMVFNYIGILIFSFAATALFCEAMRLMPVLRFLLFGMRTQKKQTGDSPSRGLDKNNMKPI